MRAVNAADPPEILVVVGQAVAARVIPVMPEGTQITDGDAISVTGHGFKEVVAVKWEVSGWFFHGFQRVDFNVFSIMTRVPPRRTNSRRSFASGT